MRYEYPEHFTAEEKKQLPESLQEVLQGTLTVIIHPEQTNISQLFIALIQSAYEMKGNPGLGGLAALNSHDSISKRAAAKYLLYDTKSPILDSLRMRPDNRPPFLVGVDYINGRAVKLLIYEYAKDPITYEMAAHRFTENVGSIDELFRLTQQKLEK